jgi:hypothetical protein
MATEVSSGRQIQQTCAEAIIILGEKSMKSGAFSPKTE